MIFYSREIGRDGELDHIDSAEFKDVYFEKDEFEYVLNSELKTSKITFSLEYGAIGIEPKEEVYIKGACTVDGVEYTSSVVVDPVMLVEQGAIAYYEEKLLDDIDEVKSAKSQISSKLKSQILDAGFLLRGTNIDVLAVMINNNNIIATLDDITILDGNRIKASKHYSIVNIGTVVTGAVEVYLSNERKIVGQIDSVAVENGEVTITFSNTSIEANEETVYKKSSEFSDIESYYADRAQYINIGDAKPEADFDEFDDLF